MSIDSLRAMPGVLVEYLSNNIRSLILDSSFDLNQSARTSSGIIGLTRSIGNTTNAPTAPAMPPIVKS